MNSTKFINIAVLSFISILLLYLPFCVFKSNYASENEDILAKIEGSWSFRDTICDAEQLDSCSLIRKSMLIYSNKQWD